MPLGASNIGTAAPVKTAGAPVCCTGDPVPFKKPDDIIIVGTGGCEAARGGGISGADGVVDDAAIVVALAELARVGGEGEGAGADDFCFSSTFVERLLTTADDFTSCVGDEVACVV